MSQTDNPFSDGPEDEGIPGPSFGDYVDSEDVSSSEERNESVFASLIQDKRASKAARAGQSARTSTAHPSLAAGEAVALDIKRAGAWNRFKEGDWLALIPFAAYSLEDNFNDTWNHPIVRKPRELVGGLISDLTDDLAPELTGFIKRVYSRAEEMRAARVPNQPFEKTFTETVIGANIKEFRKIKNEGDAELLIKQLDAIGREIGKGMQKEYKLGFKDHVAQGIAAMDIGYMLGKDKRLDLMRLTLNDPAEAADEVTDRLKGSIVHKPGLITRLRYGKDSPEYNKANTKNNMEDTIEAKLERNAERFKSNPPEGGHVERYQNEGKGSKQRTDDVNSHLAV